MIGRSGIARIGLQAKRILYTQWVLRVDKNEGTANAGLSKCKGSNAGLREQANCIGGNAGLKIRGGNAGPTYSLSRYDWMIRTQLRRSFFCRMTLCWRGICCRNVSVCPLVFPPQAGILSKRLYGYSWVLLVTGASCDLSKTVLYGNSGTYVYLQK